MDKDFFVKEIEAHSGMLYRVSKTAVRAVWKNIPSATATAATAFWRRELPAAVSARGFLATQF